MRTCLLDLWNQVVWISLEAFTVQVVLDSLDKSVGLNREMGLEAVRGFTRG